MAICRRRKRSNESPCPFFAASDNVATECSATKVRQKRQQTRSNPRSLLFLFLLVVPFWSQFGIVTAAAAASTARSSSSCLYSLLGCSRDASESELKKAYRRACLKHHPDKPGGNEETFKDIQHAYDILSDSNKRQLYDQYGQAGVDAAKAAGGTGTGFSPGASPSSQSFYFSSNNNNGNYDYGGEDPQQAFFRMFAAANGMPHGGTPFTHGPSSFGERSRSSHHGNQQPHVDLEQLIRQMMMGGQQHQYYQPQQQERRTKQQPSSSTKAPVFERRLYYSPQDLLSSSSLIKKVKVTHHGYQRIYQIVLQPHWKPGTKLKYSATKEFPFEIHFILTPTTTTKQSKQQQQQHIRLERRGNDLVYRHKIDTTKQRANTGTTVWVEIPVVAPDGSTTTGQTVTRKIPAHLYRPNQSLTIPNQGLPIPSHHKRGGGSTTNNNNGAAARGNLIVEFY